MMKLSKQFYQLTIKHALIITGLASACLCSVYSQEVAHGVATITSVAGNVLVSNEYGLASVSGNFRLENRARVMTTVRSKAEIVFDDGCKVPIEENNGFTVETGKSCEALRSQVKPMFESPELASPGVSSSNVSAAPIASSVGASPVGSLSSASTLGAKSTLLSASTAGSAAVVDTTGAVGAAAGSVNSVVGLGAVGAFGSPATAIAAAAAAAGYSAYSNARGADAVSPS